MNEQEDPNHHDQQHGSDSEMEDDTSQGMNNNANIANIVCSAGGNKKDMDYKDFEDTGVRIKPIDKEEQRKSEEMEMQKFVDFMKKQGLVIVESSKLETIEQRHGNQTGKQRMGSTLPTLDKRGTFTCPDFQDNNSVVTVYRNAVQQAPVNSK